MTTKKAPAKAAAKAPEKVEPKGNEEADAAHDAEIDAALEQWATAKRNADVIAGDLARDDLQPRHREDLEGRLAGFKATMADARARIGS